MFYVRNFKRRKAYHFDGILSTRWGLEAVAIGDLDI